MREIGQKTMQRTCLNCGRRFEASSERAEYCSGRCRAEASRRRKDQALSAALNKAERALREVRQMLWRDSEG